MSKAWANGSTRAWRKARAAVLADNLLHNGGRCVVRTEVCTGMADCVHHTKGRLVTGDDPRFMVASCTDCNLKIGDPNAGVPVDPKPRPMTRW